MRTRYIAFSKTRQQRWMRVGSILISLAAVTLLGTAFGAHFYSGSSSSVLLTLSLIALCIAIGLHVRFLLLARREHRETVNVLDATEQEYKSVFDSTLDGILILDDQAVCLEANPAALKLFGTSRQELVGEPIQKFFTCAEEFKEGWDRFLDRKSEHRESRALRGDGEAIFVEYTATAHYLPGRHVAVLRDITRRKLAEEALRKSEERFQEMARNIEEIFWTLNYDILRFVSGFFAKAMYPVFFGLFTDWHSHLLEMPVLDGLGKRAFPLQQALNGGMPKVEATPSATSYRLPFH